MGQRVASPAGNVRAAELRPTSCSINRKLASMVAETRITVNGGEAHDRQALDYALYHLRITTPAHDERSSIAAKGLTGEG
ncbi:hypothetical protein ACLK19_08985 [Escherichia coli]